MSLGYGSGVYKRSRRRGQNNRGQTTIISACDNLGNLTEKKRADNSEITTFTWDQRNQLAGINKTGSNPTIATLTNRGQTTIIFC